MFKIEYGLNIFFIILINRKLKVKVYNIRTLEISEKLI